MCWPADSARGSPTDCMETTERSVLISVRIVHVCDDSVGGRGTDLPVRWIRQAHRKQAQGPELGRGTAPSPKGAASLRQAFGTAGKMAPLRLVAATLRCETSGLGLNGIL